MTIQELAERLGPYLAQDPNLGVAIEFTNEQDGGSPPRVVYLERTSTVFRGLHEALIIGRARRE